MEIESAPIKAPTEIPIRLGPFFYQNLRRVRVLGQMNEPEIIEQMNATIYYRVLPFFKRCF